MGLNLNSTWNCLENEEFARATTLRSCSVKKLCKAKFKAKPIIVQKNAYYWSSFVEDDDK